MESLKNEKPNGLRSSSGSSLIVLILSRKKANLTDLISVSNLNGELSQLLTFMLPVGQFTETFENDFSDVLDWDFSGNDTEHICYASHLNQLNDFSPVIDLKQTVNADDVAAADKLTLHIELGNGRPV